MRLLCYLPDIYVEKYLIYTYSPQCCEIFFWNRCFDHKSLIANFLWHFIIRKSWWWFFVLVSVPSSDRSIFHDTIWDDKFFSSFLFLPVKSSGTISIDPSHTNVSLINRSKHFCLGNMMAITLVNHYIVMSWDKNLWDNTFDQLLFMELSPLNSMIKFDQQSSSLSLCRLWNSHLHQGHHSSLSTYVHHWSERAQQTGWGND